MWEQEPWLFSYHSPCTWQTAQHRTGTQKPASESVCKTSSYSMSLTAFCHRLTNYNYISFRSYALPMGLTKSSCQVSPWFVSQDFPGKVSLLSLLQCPLTGSPLPLYLCQAKGAAWVVQFSRQQHSLGSALSRDQTLFFSLPLCSTGYHADKNGISEYIQPRTTMNVVQHKTANLFKTQGDVVAAAVVFVIWLHNPQAWTLWPKVMSGCQKIGHWKNTYMHMYV